MRKLDPDEYDRLIALLEEKRELERLSKTLTLAPLDEIQWREKKITALYDEIFALFFSHMPEDENDKV